MIPEDAEHVVFNCPGFAAYRAVAVIGAGVGLSPENIVDEMLNFEKTGRPVEKLMKAIHNLLTKKELRGEIVNNGTSRTSYLILSRDIIPKWQPRRVSEAEGGGFSE